MKGFGVGSYGGGLCSGPPITELVPKRVAMASGDFSEGNDMGL